MKCTPFNIFKRQGKFVKQGILISAYKDLEHIEEIMNFFNDDFLFYIHLDSKSKFPPGSIDKVKNHRKVVFFSRLYKTNWGSLNTLKSIILLAREALKNNEIGYIHAISGGDFPVKNSNYFTEYLLLNKGKEYIETFPLPAAHWADGGMNRLHYYNLYDLANAKRFLGNKVIQLALKVQKKLKVKRKISADLPKLHGGSTWWTLSRECVKYVVEYTDKNPALLNRLKYSFCSEELYFQTLIMNSSFKEKVVNENLRFINWEYKHGSMPAILDEHDYSNIKKAHHLFARKFEGDVSFRLKNLIKSEYGIK